MAQILRSENLKLVNKVGSSNIVLFDNLNLFVSEKEWVSINIPHGGGKTALYQILFGQKKSDYGKIIYHSHDKIDDYDKEKFIRENMTGVPEYPTFLENFTVKDWIKFQTDSLRISGISKRRSEFFKLLESQKINLEKHLSQLSLLEIRKIEILFSYLADTILIVCDDIDVGLSKDELQNLEGLLKTIKKDKAILTISSNPSWLKFADKVVRI